MPRPLYVTKPLLPSLAELQELLGQIWETKILTNGGPLHQKLESELLKRIGVPTVKLFNNGTIALIVAMKMVDLPRGSEVITTPLTFAATAHAISWNGLVPVFADISPDTLTINPEAVEKAITERTSAILAVHVYGTVCDVGALKTIADQHNLRLIYDAAHAFDVTVNGQSIATFGDVSVFSFHATKLFNTLEGGLIATPRSDDRETIDNLRNFGIKSEEEVVSVGINGKMNEIQAAVGLLNLPLVDRERNQRTVLREKYDRAIGPLSGIATQKKQPGVVNSEQYYRIVVDASSFGRSRNDLYESLKKRGIFARKYFHPICTDFVPYKGWPVCTTRRTPYVDTVKTQVLCLPFHSGVTDEDVAEIGYVFNSRNDD